MWPDRVAVLPLPLPLVIQFSNLAASNQFTYVIGRLALTITL